MGIEESLDWTARGLAEFTAEDNSISLCTARNIATVKITLATDDYNDDETMSRLVMAVERIADSLGRLAGLSRPRLESWREQEEYEPRHKSSVCDGGTPGARISV